MKKNIFFASLKSLKKGVGSGSIGQRYGSADPDPHQNVTNPQHCRWATAHSPPESGQWKLGSSPLLQSFCTFSTLLASRWSRNFFSELCSHIPILLQCCEQCNGSGSGSNILGLTGTGSGVFKIKICKIYNSKAEKNLFFFFKNLQLIYS
jgi:hypothetical protein